MRALRTTQHDKPISAAGLVHTASLPPSREVQWSTVVLEAPRSRWRVVGLSLAVLACASAWGAYTWANRPQVAVLGVSQVQSQARQVVDASLQQVVTGQYATKLPAVFVIRERQDVAAGVVLNRLVATETADSSGQLAIMVRKLPDGGMEQSSDITHRELYSNKYSQESFDWLPSGAKAYRANDTYEIGVFMTHGSQYVSVVMSNTSISSVYDEWLRVVIENWRWLP